MERRAGFPETMWRSCQILSLVNSMLLAMLSGAVYTCTVCDVGDSETLLVYTVYVIVSPILA